MEEKKIKKTSKGIIILIIVLTTIFMLGFIGLFIFSISEFDAGEYTTFDPSIAGDVVINNKVEITGVTQNINSTNGKYYISGYLQNMGKNAYDIVTVEYSLYDRDGVLLDRVSANISNLEKQEKWKFYLEYNGNTADVYQYKLSKVSYY